MLVRDSLVLSLHNLMLHKVRSLLTTLGIIFGVASVISMLAISEGAKRQSLAQIEAMGIDNIIIHTEKPSSASRNVSGGASSTVEEFGLTRIDMGNIKKMDNISRITAIRNTRRKIMRGTEALDILVLASDISLPEDTNSEITDGRWLTPADNANLFPVCVVGRNVPRKIFGLGHGNVTGQKVYIENIALKIVGVIENRLGTQFYGISSLNDAIYLPLETATALFGTRSFELLQRRRSTATDVEFDVFIVKVADISYIDDTSKRISGYLEKSHSKVKDWSMSVPLTLFKQKEQTQRIFTVVMSSIAGISLLVGGIGIMNIMLANVYERRKEIGCRRALGAKKRDILTQFLIETVSLSSIGGFIGIFLGVGISWTVNHYAQWPVIFPTWSIISSFLISAAVGVAFGTYPAWKAAQQDPIEVLRAE